MSAQVLAAIANAALRSPPGSTVVLACSGGGDSVTLTRAAAPILRARGVAVVLAHLDHGLRPAGGVADEAFVSDLAAELSLPLVRRRQRPSPRLLSQVGVQAAARQVRLEFLEGLAQRLGGAAVWLAQHQDDQLETLWMRHGAAPPIGMPARRHPFVRPLLDVPRSELRALAAEAGWSWREDPSNTNSRFARTQARQHVAGLDPIQRAELLAAGARAARLRAERTRRVEDQLPGVLLERPDGLLDLDRAAFVALDEDAEQLLFLLLSPALPGARSPSRAAVRDLVGLAARAPDGLTRRQDLGAGWTATVRGDRISLRQHVEPPSPPITWVARDVSPARARRLLARCPRHAGRRFAVIDADTAGPLRLGQAGSGRRFRPHGMRGTRLLRDVLAEAGVPESARESWPVVETTAGKVLWLTGIRASAEAHLRVDSTRVTLLYTVAPLNWGPPQRLDS